MEIDLIKKSLTLEGHMTILLSLNSIIILS